MASAEGLGELLGGYKNLLKVHWQMLFPRQLGVEKDGGMTLKLIGTDGFWLPATNALGKCSGDNTTYCQPTTNKPFAFKPG